MLINLAHKTRCPFRFLLVILLACTTTIVHAQVGAPADSLKADSLGKRGKKISPPHGPNLNKQYDFSDLARNILHPHKKADSLHKRSPITVVPNIAANPTIGFQGGIKAVGAFKTDNDPNTLLSTGATSASITTKGIIYMYINHNIFTPGNKWNLQGNLVVSKSVTPDHGIGIGVGKYEGSAADQILADPTHKGYAVNSIYFNFREKVYKQVSKGLFLGGGYSIEHRQNMKVGDSLAGPKTPLAIYNAKYGFANDHSSAAGFLFNVEYTSRDNPNRAYKGFYLDAGIRINQTWIGSTKNAVQFTTDIRKYFSLSDASPETVLALWNWGSYLASGTVPYLELPGSTRDGTGRSDRGYVSQFFKGTQFNDSEAELRFPLLANKFVSGVVFGNLETANDLQGTKLFQVFQPGYGAGLRILFNKVTRTNLALDYAWGRYGSKGFFLNLNEAF